MRKSFIIIAITILSFACIDIVFPIGERPFGDKLREMINTCELETYVDDAFGFAAEYPKFFDKEDGSDEDCIGHAKFSYWDHWIMIVMECYATPNKKRLNVHDGMNEHAKMMHARKKQMGRDWFIISGRLYNGDIPVDGYSYHIKYVRNGGLWFVYALYYPDQYKYSLARLFHIINDWKVWDKRKPLKLKFK